MWVARAVAEAVVLAVVPGPPDGPTLAAGRHAQAQQGLEQAGSLVGAVRKIAVRARFGEKHARDITQQRCPQQFSRDGHKKNAQTHEVRDQQPHGDDAATFTALKPILLHDADPNEV